MNDLMSLYKHFIYMDGGLKHCDLTDIIHQINKTPQKNIGWGYSIDLAKELYSATKAHKSINGDRNKHVALFQTLDARL